MKKWNALGPAPDIAALSTGESIDWREYKDLTEKKLETKTFKWTNKMLLVQHPVLQLFQLGSAMWTIRGEKRIKYIGLRIYIDAENLNTWLRKTWKMRWCWPAWNQWNQWTNDKIEMMLTCLIISKCLLASVEVCSFRLLNWKPTIGMVC